MRRTKILLILALTVATMVAVVSTSSADSIAGSGWWSGFTIQNSATGSATVLANAYHKTGASATVYDSSVNVLSGNSVTFHPGFGATCAQPPSNAVNGCRIGFNTDLPGGFEGSVVVSADVEIVAFAQVNNNKSGSVGVTGGTARSAYQGTGGSLAASTLYFPTVKNNFANQSTIFYVQAAGEDADVTITYTMEDGSTHTELKTISANKTYAFVPTAASVANCGGATCDGGIGSAIVTAADSKLIAGSVVEYREGVSVAEYVLATRALTPSEIGTKIVAPTMKNVFYGATTGASILNTAATQVVVDLSFSVTNVMSGCSANIGDTATAQVTIPAKSSTVVSRFRNNVGGLPDCVFYAMTATSQGSQELAVTVNEAQSSSGSTRKAVYFGFNIDNAGSTVLFPLVKENFAKNTTGLTLVNVGSIATKLHVTYQGASTHIIETITLSEGQAVPLRQVFRGPNSNYTSISGGYPDEGGKYAVTVEVVTAGAKIVGLGQEATISGTTLDIYNFEGFSQ